MTCYNGLYAPIKLPCRKSCVDTYKMQIKLDISMHVEKVPFRFFFIENEFLCSVQIESAKVKFCDDFFFQLRTANISLISKLIYLPCRFYF